MADSIDLDVVESLKELGGEEDPGLFAELVDVFLADTPARIEAIAQAVAGNDAHGLAGAAHGLKSSAANMGAVGLATLCKQLEAAGRSRTMTGLDALVTRARQEFAAAGQILRDAAR